MDKEREVFDEWYGIKPKGWFEAIRYNTAWKAWKAAKAQAVPDGFVLVPKEPTAKLLNEMQDHFVGAFSNGLTGGQSIHCAYRAMIAAAQEQDDD